MSLSLTLNEPRSGALGTIVKAVVSGGVIAVVGMGLWGGLGLEAMKNPAFMPYLVPAMVAILVVGALYLKYGQWPRTGAAFRNQAVRLNPVKLKPFLLSLAAGWSTMLTGFCLYVAHRMAGGMGGESALVFPHAPFAVLLPGLIMAGVVAGTVEEIGFRGFMQGTLERRFGVVPAILISGFVWALFHTNHSYFAQDVALWFAMFLAISFMLGGIAHRTDSLLPGIAVHSGFDITYFVFAGALAPRIAPIAWVQSFATPPELVVAASGFAVVMAVSWIAFFRATKEA
jgi:membrane protease YdiL (CAAX protease family)